MDYQGEELRSLLALLRVPGMGPSKLNKLLNNNVNLQNAFDPKGNCQLMAGTADWRGVDKDLRWLSKPNCYMISQQASSYPPLLKETQGAPSVLFVQGNLAQLSRPQIAMVGSRNPTPQGSDTAKKFAHHFSEKGFTVTSGLAIGIDGVSHSGALQDQGGTIAVLGCGLDRIYPSTHENLAQEIIQKGGSLVSEFPIGTPPTPSHFPRRNRIISGLAVGTLVVEAALNSGSLITAKYAIEQGREVFAIPGSIHSPLTKGCHALIRQGAKLVETAQDVLEELGTLIRFVMRKENAEAKPKLLAENLNTHDAALLSQIGYECTSMDALVARSGLTAKAVSIMLLDLELKGFVVSVPGGYARLLI